MMKGVTTSIKAYQSPLQGSPFPFFLLTYLSFVLANCNLCFTSQNLTKSTLNCIYTYSYQCSPTPTLLSF